jgi:hypothetical protein
MKNSGKKIETAANCAIVVVSLLLAVVLFKNHFLPQHRTQSPAISPGDKVSLSQVDWEAHGQTLVLALQKGCHFCTESAPFYKRLVREAAKHGRTHLVAVLPNSADESQSYLAQLGVSIPEIRQAWLSGVTGTPTLILVDHKGVVLRVWREELPPEKEQEVLEAIS